MEGNTSSSSISQMALRKKDRDKVNLTLISPCLVLSQKYFCTCESWFILPLENKQKLKGEDSLNQVPSVIKNIDYFSSFPNFLIFVMVWVFSCHIFRTVRGVI